MHSVTLVYLFYALVDGSGLRCVVWLHHSKCFNCCSGSTNGQIFLHSGPVPQNLYIRESVVEILYMLTPRFIGARFLFRLGVNGLGVG